MIRQYFTGDNSVHLNVVVKAFYVLGSPPPGLPAFRNMLVCSADVFSLYLFLTVLLGD